MTLIHEHLASVLARFVLRSWRFVYLFSNGYQILDRQNSMDVLYLIYGEVFAVEQLCSQQSDMSIDDMHVDF